MVHPHASSDRAAVNMAHPRVSFLTVWLLAIPPSVQAEAEMKVYLRDLAFSSAREVEVTTNKKAIIITVRVLSNHARLACPRSVGRSERGTSADDPCGVLLCVSRCRTACCRSTTSVC